MKNKDKKITIEIPQSLAEEILELKNYNSKQLNVIVRRLLKEGVEAEKKVNQLEKQIKNYEDAKK